MKIFIVVLICIAVTIHAADEDNIEHKAANAVSSGAQGAANTVTNVRNGVSQEAEKVKEGFHNFGEKVDQKAAEYRKALDQVPEKVAGAAVAAKDTIGKGIIGAGEAITSDQAIKEHEQKGNQ